MALHTVEEKVIITITLYSPVCSDVAVTKRYCLEFSFRVATPRTTMYRILNSLKKQEVHVINVQNDINLAGLWLKQREAGKVTSNALRHLFPDALEERVLSNL